MCDDFVDKPTKCITSVEDFEKELAHWVSPPQAVLVAPVCPAGVPVFVDKSIEGYKMYLKENTLMRIAMSPDFYIEFQKRLDEREQKEEQRVFDLRLFGGHIDGD